MPRIRAHVLVKGQVQGVRFRSATCAAAQRFGVTGWVKNLSDGRVEAVFEGDEAAVETATAWCRTGPPAARVEHVSVERGPYTGEFADFTTVKTVQVRTLCTWLFRAWLKPFFSKIQPGQ